MPTSCRPCAAEVTRRRRRARVLLAACLIGLVGTCVLVGTVLIDLDTGVPAVFASVVMAGLLVTAFLQGFAAFANEAAGPWEPTGGRQRRAADHYVYPM